MKKILVPTDFSDIANNALEFAVEIARKNGASIELLNVSVFPASEVGIYYSVYSINKSMDEAWDEILKENDLKLKSCIDKYPDVKITPFLAESDNDFVKELLNHEADLIVIGSHGAEGFREIISGSNSEEVVRLSNCPVLVVKDETSAFNPSKVVFAVDLSKHTNYIKKAIDNLPIGASEKHFIYIDNDMKRINYADTKEQMSKLVGDLNISNTVFNVVESNTIEEGILGYAKEIEAGMIIMYTHGRTGISHFFKGSIAEDLVNHSNIPVFTFVEN